VFSFYLDDVTLSNI